MTTSETVLVVDDEPDVCWALEKLLIKNYFKVVTVGGGAETLRWLKQWTPACCLILLDAKLADIEGVELAQRIRTQTSCTAPMILVSGYFYKDDSIVQDNLRTGLISAFVTKPVHHDELLKAIQRVLYTKQISH
tara:strand:- start:421 stop:822 length:402 start_codon:yes stop_codon:yes gene_type:complete